MKNKSLLVRVSFAIAGIVAAARRERSFRTQLAAGAVTAAVTAVLQPGLFWSAAVFLSIGLVLALELVNSAVERLVDHLHPQPAPEIGAVKDMAAGAVLVASAVAVAVGCLMLWSKLGS